MHKVMHMDDYKVVEEEAEHTPMLVTGRDPKSHTAPLKFPLLWASVTHPYILTASCFIHGNSFNENHCSNSAVLTQEGYHKETTAQKKTGMIHDKIFRRLSKRFSFQSMSL